MCSTCEGSGFIAVLKDEKNNIVESSNSRDKKTQLSWIPCSCFLEKNKQKFIDHRINKSGLDKNLFKFSIENYKNKELIVSIETIMGNLISLPNVLWLYGDINTGKTVLVHILGKALIESGLKVKFFKTQNLFNIFMDFEKKDRIPKLKYDVIILDDLFNPKRSYLKGDYLKAQFYNFLDEKLSSGCKFIITSNNKLMNLPKIYVDEQNLLARSYIELEFANKLVQIIRSRPEIIQSEPAIIAEKKSELNLIDRSIAQVQGQGGFANNAR